VRLADRAMSTTPEPRPLPPGPSPGSGSAVPSTASSSESPVKVFGSTIRRPPSVPAISSAIRSTGVSKDRTTSASPPPANS
jgi:hypothetical protein